MPTLGRSAASHVKDARFCDHLAKERRPDESGGDITPNYGKCSRKVRHDRCPYVPLGHQEASVDSNVVVHGGTTRARFGPVLPACDVVRLPPGIACVSRSRECVCCFGPSVAPPIELVDMILKLVILKLA